MEMHQDELERTRWLILRAGGKLCAIDIAHVAETMRPLPIEPLAGAPPGVLGLAVIRGEPVPVVDLGALLGGQAGAVPGRLVTVRAGERLVALAAGAVAGIHMLEPSTLRRLPPLVETACGDRVARLGLLDRELLHVLSAARLLEPGDWHPLGRPAG